MPDGLPTLPFLRDREHDCTLAVRAQPGARRTAISGVYGSGATASLKIAVQAPPIDGRANQELIGFLAAIFLIPRSAISVLSGDTARSKVFLLKGMNADLAAKLLGLSWRD